MAGLMDRGAATLVSRMQTAAGRPVTYTRLSDGRTVAPKQLPDGTFQPLIGWVGNTLYSRTTEEPGASVVWGDRDYLIAVADLVIDGAVFSPSEGDRISETMPDGTVVTFELQTPTGEPPYRYSDQTRRIWRLHCKRV